MAHATPIPRYFLYGEPLRDVEVDFLHVERIATRSRIHDWTIRPHSHPDQHQILCLAEGTAGVRIETRSWDVAAPAVVVVPAMAVHGFVFSPHSDGYVVTAARDVVARACAGDADLRDLFGQGACVCGPALDMATLRDCLDSLEREFVWSAPARRAAIGAHMQRLLVALARTDGLRGDGATGGGDRDAELVGRYREALERGFRLRRGVDALAAEVGVSRSRLDRACRAATGRSALSLLHERVMIEAKRSLLYTAMTVCDVAHALGFDDPAYFSRFFAIHAGVSPRRFRDGVRDRPAGTSDSLGRMSAPTGTASLGDTSHTEI